MTPSVCQGARGESMIDNALCQKHIKLIIDKLHFCVQYEWHKSQVFRQESHK